MAMVTMAASAFHAGHSDVADTGGALPRFSHRAPASAISSSGVGAIAGQMIMQGFVGFRIPVLLRRLVTTIPAFAVIALRDLEVRDRPKGGAVQTAPSRAGGRVG